MSRALSSTTRWDLDHLSIEVPASRPRTWMAFGCLGAAVVVAVIGARLGSPLALLGLLPATALARHLMAPMKVVAGFRGVRVGRTWIPREHILAASPGRRSRSPDGASEFTARLALTDGRIVHVPMPGVAEIDAVVRALARPAALFESVHAREHLHPLREG
jgi:hypothetical protein